MTTPLASAWLDRWLICCEQAFRSLETHWREEAGAESLLAWRLEAGLIVLTPPAGIAAALQAFAGRPPQAGVTILLADLDGDDAAVTLADLPPGLRIQAWRENPIAAVVGMNAPDAWLLAALRQDGAGAGPVNAGPIDLRYVRALKSWEAGARQNSPDAFAEIYPSFARQTIPWTGLLAPGRSAPSASFSAWPATRLQLLAAATPRAPFRVVAPPSSEARWILSWAPVIGRSGGYLVLQAEGDAVTALAGRRIVVTTAGLEFDLGALQPDGFAEVFVAHDLEASGFDVWIEPRPES